MPADILLPKKNVDLNKYSTIACDQYTSEEEYWIDVKKISENVPTALDLVLPEVWLSETPQRVPKINGNMLEYEKNVFEEYKNTFVYVERVLPSNGKVRCGIVGVIDLEDYSYEKGSHSPIRATEGTVLSRIPPRVAVRENASVELPHIMLFCDDNENEIMQPLFDGKNNLKKAYGFDLMKNGGHIDGWFVDKENGERLIERIQKYADGKELVFAVGDGNHSLATAKACYENLKSRYGDEARNMKARYALCELVNIHSPAIEFEPIYRLVMNVDADDLLGFLDKKCEDGFEYEYYTKNKNGKIRIPSGTSSLPVGALQTLLDEYLKAHDECEIDYIHGADSLKRLSEKENCIGFVFDGMGKNELFSSVAADGSLPRKTFSMGHADDKRFYLEARKIKD